MNIDILKKDIIVVIVVVDVNDDEAYHIFLYC